MNAIAAIAAYILRHLWRMAQA